MKPIDMSQLLNQLSQSATEAPRSAVDRVFEDLRRRIVSLELAPDTTLVRTELCQEYGVSQTPVREALQRLEQAGLIKIFPQSRTQVARIEVGRLNETQFLREALESEVVRRLAQEHDARLVERLNGIIDMQAMLIGEPDQTAAFYRLDELFHETMFAAAGQTGLYRMLRDRSGHMARVRHLHLPSEGKTRSVVESHRSIVDAIAEGSAEQAVIRMRDHLEGTISRIQRLRDAYPDYFAD